MLHVCGEAWILVPHQREMRTGATENSHVRIFRLVTQEATHRIGNLSPGKSSDAEHQAVAC